MKLLTATVSNFASYSNLTFNFENLGLTLIQGATGSGKSTLNAIPGWILFGVSSKNGNVDEIRNWKHLGAPTAGSIDLVIDNGSKITVTRIRGRSNENDLYAIVEGSPNKLRGKDLNDTQTLIDHMVGFTAEEYFLASTFNEFSESASFFLAKAKDRRDLLEKLADLSFPLKLEDAVAERKSALKKKLVLVNHKISSHIGSIEELQRGLSHSNKSSCAWKTKQKELLAELESKHKNFDDNKQKQIVKLENRIQELEEAALSDNIFATKIGELKQKLNECTEEKCVTCGNSLSSNERITYQKDITLLREAQLENNVLLANKKSFMESLKSIKESVNNYQEMLNREIIKENPFLKQIERANSDLAKKILENDQTKLELTALNQEAKSIELLKDLSYNLRASLLSDTVNSVQNRTNQYLEQYFDAALRVTMSIQDSDKLEVSIQNNGYDCVYTQLSKGQRQLLRLCFSISVMEAASNKVGTSVEAIFLDEALDGLDSNLKIKAFRLLQELANKYATVLVVDHAVEFHELFTTRYQVTLVDDESKIEGDLE